ncbi:MAG TPA: HDIG domain-containing protein [Chloroflexi bacterium]|nr:HDIG domain-containing protein [Chloroflexota bacterium]
MAPKNQIKTLQQQPGLMKWLRALLYGVFVLGLVAIMVYPYYLSDDDQEQIIGDVSNADILAPYTLTYQSSLLTESARELAANQVEPIYFEVDPSIARQQIERLQIILNYIDLIRHDTFASTEEKLSDLAIVPELSMTTELAVSLLNLSANEWELMQQESIIVLEQVMRNTIRNGDIESAREQIPRLISFTFAEESTQIITEIVSPLVVANSLFNAEATETARQTARSQVEPITTTYVSGQRIIGRGEIITPLIWESLEQYNLVEISDTTRDLIAAVVIAVVIGIGFISSVSFDKNKLGNKKFLGTALLVLFFLLYLFMARFLVPGHTIIPYLYPVAGFGLAISFIYSTTVGIVTSLFLGLLSAFALPIDMSLTAYYFITSVVGLFVLGDGRRIAKFIESSLVIGLVGSAVVIAYRLPSPNMDWVGVISLSLAAFANGIFSSILALFFRFLFGKALDIITPLELLDLSRPDHPLLQRLLSYAPGSYQHSLQVSNLAEQAARVIGADALLTRVGALFHDVGKAQNPQYFIENQVPGQPNPHEDLPPQKSSKTIQDHVTEGLQLAKKYKLPKQIQSFIAEHHGTSVTNYQLVQALNQSDDPDAIDPNDFQYPGPAPASRETALVMLADSCEARSRAELPGNIDELRAIIADQIEKVRESGQLDNTELTLRDLAAIRESFVNTLINTQHTRIKYPKRVESTGEDEK